MKRHANGSFDGLSDLHYELQSVQLRPLYTWILADLNGKAFSSQHIMQLASCLIYARALLEYVIFIMWVAFCYQDVTVRVIREDKVLTFLILREKC